ncbi:hypothetical protein WA026_008201 [Henosepilachna vigintioctopunctata]|uniref:Uncharacterized protein n=1 Tax=Henosepilachna vigintioctopunctata TaxID=420089 RepID=A0AAW1TQJ6_9CUCU
MPFWESSSQRNNFAVNKNASLLSDRKLDDFWKPMYPMQKVISNSISEKPILKIPKIIETSWTTVDDIIQRVVENRCESSISRSASESGKSQLKIPSLGATNSVDAIIEEVVRGNIGCSQKDNIINNNKGLTSLVGTIDKESRILNSITRKKLTKITKKDNLSNINIEEKSIASSATKTHENVTILTNNKDDILPNINKTSTLETDSPASNKHSRTSDYCSFPEVSNWKEEQLYSYSEVKNEVCALVDINVSEAQTIDIMKKARTSTASIYSGDQKSNQGLIDVEPMMVSCRKDDKNVEQVYLSPIELKGSAKVEENIKIHCEKESQSEKVTENIEQIQTNTIQEVHLAEVETSSSIKNMSDTVATTDTSFLTSSLQTLNYQNAEIQSLIVNVGTEGEAIEECKKDEVFSNSSLPVNSQIIGCYEEQKSDLYSTPEDEPTILEEKGIFEDLKKSSSTDSEDDLPLVILKAKSKNISTAPLIFTKNANTLKSFESESTECTPTKLNNISDVSTELYRSSLSSKQTTTKFSLPTAEKSTTQSKDKEVNEHTADIKFKEANVELQQKFDRRRSTRKSSVTKKSLPETTTKGILRKGKEKKSKYAKSKYSNKKSSFINVRNEIADVNYSNTTFGKSTEKVPNDKIALHVNDVISNDTIITETASEKHSISVEDLISKKESKISSRLENSESTSTGIISKNNKTLSAIPVFKISKMKFNSKDKDKNKSVKSKLILKLPKIVLKEPTLKLPFAENDLEKDLVKKKNETKTNEINSVNINRTQSSLNNDCLKINESAISSQELIKKTELTGIKLKLKTKDKKKHKNKKDSFLSNKNQGIIKTLSSEVDGASVLLTDISKTLNTDPNISCNLSITTENKVSKEISEFLHDESDLNEAKKSSTNCSIFSLAKLKSLRRCKQKRFYNKKKKDAKAEPPNFSSFPSEIYIESSPIDSAINTSLVIENKTVESDAITDTNQSSSTTSLNDKLNDEVANHKNKVMKKAKKHKVRTNEPGLLSSFCLAESDSTIEMSNNVKTQVLETNQSVNHSVNKSLISGNIHANISTEKSKAVIETSELDIHCGSIESISKSNLDEKTTKNSEIDHKDNNMFGTITELSTLSCIGDKQSKNISMETVTDEKKGTSNSKAARV